MNFVEGERWCFDKDRQEQQQQEEELEEVMTSKPPFPFSSPSTKYKSFAPENQNLWPESFYQSSQQDSKTKEPSPSFDKKLELMDLSLETNTKEAHSTTGASSSESMEKEHMFHKIVTPSDVGKLNRLVIPKQHAERYFPLDSSSNEKGLLLNFEDRNGKPWRFRYSYWNSSQSYVMTKGWSRFVKEKKLDAGDIVSFQRGVGDSGKHRLFIDWRRRSTAPDPKSFPHLDLQNQLYYLQSAQWGKLPQSNLDLSMPLRCEQPQLQHVNYSIQSYQQHQQYRNHLYHYHQPPQYYLRPPGGALQIGPMHQQGGSQVPIVIDSVPAVHGKTVGKRLRLFGVNMECPTQDDQPSSVRSTHGTTVSLSPHHLASSSLPPPIQLRLPTSAPMSTKQAEFSKKGKASSSFDLDL